MSQYTLHPHERSSIEAFLEPGTHVGYLGNPDYNRAWSIKRQEPGRVLLEHWNHALAWVEVQDDAVVSFRLLEGEEARAEHARLAGGAAAPSPTREDPSGAAAVARIDVRAAAFPPDLSLTAELQKHAVVKGWQQGLLSDRISNANERRFRTRMPPLSRAMVPALYAIADEVAQRIGLEQTVELVCEAGATIGARVLVPRDGRVVVVVSSTAVERLRDPATWRFLFGHELSHVVLDHLALPRLDPQIVKHAGASLATSYFAWIRYAELSADRVGLLCSGSLEGALGALYAAGSGITEPSILAHAADSVSMLDSVEALSDTTSEVDWYETHPYVPLRIHALSAFARSEACGRLGVEGLGGSLSDAGLEEVTRRVQRLMDPLHLDPEHGAAVRAFLGVAMGAIASSDGGVTMEEVTAALLQIGPEAASLGIGIAQRGAGIAEADLAERSVPLVRDLSRGARRKLLEELVAFAAIAGVDPKEKQVVVTCAHLLGHTRSVVEEILERMEDPLA